MLGVCAEKVLKDQQYCLLQQSIFVTDYVIAFSSSYQAINAVADFLMDIPTQNHLVRIWAEAVPPNPVEACAWRLVLSIVAFRPVDSENYHRLCDPLSAADQRAFHSRWLKIQRDIDRNPPPPPPEWRAAIAGLDPVIPVAAPSPAKGKQLPLTKKEQRGLIDKVPD